MRMITPRTALAFRLALRELRGGIRGFYIFLACIALGTGAIAAVNSVSQSITDTIASQGQELLAGDVRFELNNREATPEEMAFLESLGTVSVSTGLRSMARKPDGSDQALVEVKAVDDAYPLYGSFAAEPDYPLAALLSVAAPLLLDRLGLAVGDELLLGNVKLSITGTVKTEPDALSEGFGFAPRLLVSRRALEASGLIQTGSLVEHAYKIRLQDKRAISGIQARASREFPSAGWSIRTSDRAAPSLTENITRFSQFLTLVGLTALVVAGVVKAAGRSLSRLSTLEKSPQILKNVRVSRREDSPALAQAIEKAGSQALAIEADVSDDVACASAVVATLTRFEKLTTLVNSAGVRADIRERARRSVAVSEVHDVEVAVDGAEAGLIGRNSGLRHQRRRHPALGRSGF